MTRHFKYTVPLIAAVAVVGVFTAPRASQAQAAKQAAPAGAAQLATLNTYCLGCHNDKTKTGGISFTRECIPNAHRAAQQIAAKLGSEL